MTINELVSEASDIDRRFWFVQETRIKKRTDATLTIHFIIFPELYVQVFLSERTGRCSFTLVGQSGRLYGLDREQGVWHRHPFDHPEAHEEISEGVSPQPIRQFLS